jgi:hypothetical protein
MPSVNAKIRDRVIEQELRARRVVASVDELVQARLTRLEKELRLLLVKYDPMGATGPLRRRKRERKLNKASAAATKAAYADIAKIMGKDAVALAKTSSDLMVKALREEVP